MRLLRAAFVFAAIVWGVALPMATFLATRPHGGSLAYAPAFVVYGLGSLLCHQRPERSFFLWGVQMPVCARCAGIYLGAAMAAAAFVVGRGRPFRASHSAPRLLLLFGVLPTIVTLIFEWTTGQMPANWIRAASGVPLGAVVSTLIMSVGCYTRAQRREGVRRGGGAPR